MIIRYYRRVSHGFPKEASATAPAANGNWWNASICKGRFAVTKVVGDTGTRGSIQDMYSIRSLGSTNNIPKWYVLILGLPWFTTLNCNCQNTCFDNDFTCSKVNTSAALKWADRRHPAQSPGGFDQETWHWLTGQRKSESQLELPFGITIGTSGITFWFDQQHMKGHWEKIAPGLSHENLYWPLFVEKFKEIFNCNVWLPAGILYRNWGGYICDILWTLTSCRSQTTPSPCFKNPTDPQK